MKKYIYTIISLFAMALAVSCEKDGERLVVSNPTEPTEFSASATEVRLSEATASDLALTFFWNLGEIPQLSDPDIAMPDNMTANKLQLSATEDFATTEDIDLSREQSSCQLTGLELNQKMMKLGFRDDSFHDVYARVCISMGTTTLYSSTLKLSIAAYVDDSAGTMKIVDKDTKSEVVGILRCKNETPSLYEGFVDVPGWYNGFFIADGTVWGCNNDWTPYLLVPDSKNNIWFAAPEGCQYVYVDTQNGQWWQIHTPEVTATADGATFSLTYSSDAEGFAGTITTTSDNSVITLSDIGQRYDVTTGDGNSLDSPFCLAPAADGTFSFVDGASTDAGITVATAGTYTLKMNTSTMTWTLTEGAYEGGEDGGEEGDGGDDGEDETVWPEDPDYVAATGDYLYIYASDGANPPTATAGKLAKGSDGIYTGYFHMTGWYNFQLGDSEDYSSPTILYGSAPMQDNAGLYRLYCGSDKYGIWYPDGTSAYTYLSVDTEARSWTYTVVESIEIVGDFNEYGKSFQSTMTFDETAKTWNCEIEAADWGEYGLFFIINGSWEWGLNDWNGDGVLEDGKDAKLPSVPAGKYLVTLDLNNPDNRTVTYTAL